MGLEAVPCVLRSAASGGNSSSYCTIGFLIRPSTSSTNNNATGQTVSNAAVGSTASVAVPSGSVPKSLHVVPATIQKQSATITTTAPKLVVPSVLRIQPTPCTSAHLAPPAPQPVHHPAPPKPPPPPIQHHHLQPQQQPQHCSTDGWLHAAPRSNVSSASFESPSPSQVVPQMNLNESYDCQMPCTSTTSFFPPISSITQSFSSGKSDIDLLQDMTHHVDLNPPIMHQQHQSQHVTDKTVMITPNHYTQQHNMTPPPPPQLHHYHNTAPSMMHMQDSSACTPVQASYQTHMQVELNGGMSSCHYQNNYNVVANCSPAADSGIQSIADSPPADPFTPPTPYIPPAPPITATVSKNKEPQSTIDSTSCSDDYSDMPRLIPFHQMETENGSPLTEEPPPFMTKAQPADSIVLKTADVDTLVEDEEINSVQTDETVAVSQEKTKKESDDNIPKIAITPAMNVTDLVEQLMSHMDPQQRKQFASAIQSKVAIDDTAAVDSNSTVATTDTTIVSITDSDTNSAAGATTDASASVTVAAANITTATVSAATAYDDKAMELLPKEPEHEVAVQTEFDNASKIQSCEDLDAGSETSELRSEIPENKRKTRKRKMEDCNQSVSGEIARKMKRREIGFISNDTVERRSNVDELGPDDKINANGLKRQMRLSSKNLETEMLTEERKCKGRKKQEEKKFVAEKKFPTKKLEKKRVTKEHNHEGQEGFISSVGAEEPNAHLKFPNENMMAEIKEFHMDMKRKINEQLKIVIEQIGRQFANLELDLGDRQHWDLPWYRLNWKEVTRRLVERNRLEKSKQEKSGSKICRTGDRKLPKSRKTDSFVANATPSSSKMCEKSRRSSGDYIKLKQNVIIDAYPKIEQMQCSCSSGCCGESDECLNRVVLMECGSSCPRNALCTNKRLFRRECIERLRTFQTMNGCGIGVKTDVNIDKGQLVQILQFICEYIGEVVSMETFNTRSRADYRYQRNHYALNLCPGFVVDAYRKGNIARFINHSCAPNCEMQRWSVNGHYRIGLFALRSIHEGEELTYDYNWDAFEFDDVTVCCCGALNCRHFLNKNVIMNNREKELARNTRLLLLRNVRKSAACKLKKFRKGSRSRSQSRTSKTSLTVSPATNGDAHLEQLCQEVVMKFDDSKVASKKQIKKLSNFVTELREQHTSTQTILEMLESIELKVNTLLGKSGKPLDRRKLDVWRASFASIKAKYSRQARKYGRNDYQQHHQSRKKSKTGPHRTLAAAINYKYLDSTIPIGSYDHDSFSYLGVADANTDCVRCICGTTDDDGPMIQCEKCNFWLHEECVFDEKPFDEVKDFTCIICIRNAQRTSTASIPLRIQPDYNFKNCTYYRTLVNSRHLQVRLSETVYVQKLENDNHKLILRRLVECTKQSGPMPTVVPAELEETDEEFFPVSFHRKDVRCFRIERLFSFEGHKFVFGFYYARPHEVYCEPGKLFHEKELFATNMYDTLPLDAVVGRCLALESSIYCLGRPKLPYYEEVVCFS
uniref:Histone-lysine N-methyltransferase n=1 Tax=Elaeophora elaphi TaxID=1147741 RepID=A0A0R3RIN6_9BILA